MARAEPKLATGARGAVNVEDRATHARFAFGGRQNDFYGFHSVSFLVMGAQMIARRSLRCLDLHETFSNDNSAAPSDGVSRSTPSLVNLQRASHISTTLRC